jgi:hypothetical protein
VKEIWKTACFHGWRLILIDGIIKLGRRNGIEEFGNAI